MGILLFYTSEQSGYISNAFYDTKPAQSVSDVLQCNRNEKLEQQDPESEQVKIEVI